MAHKKVLKIPTDKWYPYFNLTTGKEEEIPHTIEGEMIVMKVADIVANPVLAGRCFSAYHGDLSFSKDEEILYHFTEYNCCYDQKNFNSHVCLCVYRGREEWHKPGKCRHINYY